MKKSIVLILSALMILSGTVFASGSNEAQAESGDGPVVIEYISSTILESPEGAFEQQIIDSFNATHDDIQVKVTGVASNDLLTRYIALATSGNLPDFWLVHESSAQNIIELGVAEDLSNVFSEEYLSQFNENYLNLFSKDGVRYGLPWFAAPPGVLYRADIFEANGIEVPETWDEMIAACQALTKDGNYGMALVGAKNDSGEGRFAHVIRNFGVDEFYQDENGMWQTDVGSQNYIDALRAFTDLDLKYNVCPPGVMETGYPEAVSLFSSGRAAMLITGSNAIGAITTQVPDLVGKLGSFPIPAVKRFVAIPSGSAFYINKDSDHKEAVAVFLEYMLSDENTRAFAELTGRLPAKNFNPDDPILQKEELAGFLPGLESDYTQPSIPDYGQVRDIHGEAYTNVLSGAMSVEDAAARAQARAQQICDRANAQ